MNNTLTFEQIFLGRMFRIPDYQRGYAWEARNLTDLLEDLELLPAGRTHYTGTLVVCKTSDERFRDESGQSYEIFDVIDGQQRLTTIVILLDAIQDELRRLGLSELADGLKKMYLTVRDRIGQPHTKLTLNRDCQDYFYNNVLGFTPTVNGPTMRSHENLRHAHHRFATYLVEQANQRGATYEDWLLELYEKTTQGLTVLLYPVDNEMDAGVIFETMNDRGKPLTDLEKIKNHFLYLASKLDLKAPHSLNERINQTWNHIFEELMASGLGDDENESQLLRMHWLMVYDALPQNWKRYQTLKDRFNLKTYQHRHPQLLQDLIDYLESLQNTVTAYCDIHFPHRAQAFNNVDFSLRAQVIAASQKLVRLGMRVTFIPLLMAVRLKTTDGGKTYLQAVEACEKFDFRVYQWQRARSSAAQTIFFRLGKQFYATPNPERILASIARTTLEYCSNARFVERFQRETETWYPWSGLKYFLYEYEHHLAAQAREPVRMQWDDLWDTKRDSLEHILPQTPTESWLESFPDESRRKRWTHDIGNLTLTFDNSSLQNKSFQEKKGNPAQKSCYAGSSFFVERQLAAHAQWTENELLQRRDEIKAWALTRWHVDEPTYSEPEEQESYSDRVMRLAEEGGMADEYQTLLAFAEKHNLYLRPYASCMVFGPQTRKTIALCTIWPKNGFLDMWVWFQGIERYMNVPQARLHTIFAINASRSHVQITSENLDEFIVQLEQVFSDERNP